MKQLLAAIACATLFVGCSTDQKTTVDPTSAGSMGAAGSGSVTLPPERVAVTNPPPPRVINPSIEPFVAPTTGSPSP